MGFFRRAKAAAFRARLQMAEADRCRIVQMVTMGAQVNLARIADRMDRVEAEIRALSRELKLLEMPDSEESSDGGEPVLRG
jgi:hypothetical protein